jgi:hypothetical protein
MECCSVMDQTATAPPAFPTRETGLGSYVTRPCTGGARLSDQENTLFIVWSNKRSIYHKATIVSSAMAIRY